jgi:hypothetical protein
MDFVIDLPRAPSEEDAIWVIVDRLTKSAHLLPIKITNSLDKLAEMYVREIVRLHGVLVSIVSDCDPWFTLKFWERLQSAMDAKLNFSIAYHLQTEGQLVQDTKEISYVLENDVEVCKEDEEHQTFEEVDRKLLLPGVKDDSSVLITEKRKGLFL